MDEAGIWEVIELSESYLVCSLYEEAASLSSSVIKRIWEEAVGYSHLQDMLESAGMVLVQSLKGLGRTEEISNELKILFVDVAAVPVQVLLAGMCFQISNGTCSGVRETLEEFLRKWVYVDGGYNVIDDPENNVGFLKGYVRCCNLDVDAYMEVLGLYAVTYLGKILKDVDLALSWAEKAALPEDRRQELLRKLHSLFSVKVTNGPQDLLLLQPQKSSEALDKKCLVNGEERNKAILELSKTHSHFSWCLHPLIMKFGKNMPIISNGKIMLTLLIFLFYYVFRRKRAALMRIIRRQLASVKKALVDLWHLAFSYQVNPLAAVQPLPGPSRAA